MLRTVGKHFAQSAWQVAPLHLALEIDFMDLIYFRFQSDSEQVHTSSFVRGSVNQVKSSQEQVHGEPYLYGM